MDVDVVLGDVVRGFLGGMLGTLIGAAYVTANGTAVTPTVLRGLLWRGCLYGALGALSVRLLVSG